MPPNYFWFLSVPAAALVVHICKRRHAAVQGAVFGFTLAFFTALFLLDTLSLHYGMSTGGALLLYTAAICLVPALLFALTFWGIAFFVRQKGKTALPGLFLSTAGAASIVTTVEWFRTSFLPEGMWGHFATAWYTVPELLQFIPVTGPSGATFLLFFTGAILAGIIGRKQKLSGRARGIIALALVLFYGGLYSFGQARIRHMEEKKGTAVKTAVIHPAIPQTRRWTGNRSRQSLDRYISLTDNIFNTNEGTEEAVRLTVWPETALTHFIQSDTASTEKITALVKKNNTWLIMGAPSYEGNDINRKYYNSAYLFSPEGEMAGKYNKMYLVPFTEQGVFLYDLRASKRESLYDPGHNAVLLPLRHEGKTIRTAVPVCFEIGKPSLMENFAKGGMDLIVNISNDAWFGESGESLQQLSLLVLQCIEHGVPGIRATGYGIAAAVSSGGKILVKSGHTDPPVIEETLYLNPESHTENSFPDKWFITLCCIMIITAALFLEKQGPRATS